MTFMVVILVLIEFVPKKFEMILLMDCSKEENVMDVTQFEVYLRRRNNYRSCEKLLFCVQETILKSLKFASKICST